MRGLLVFLCFLISPSVNAQTIQELKQQVMASLRKNKPGHSRDSVYCTSDLSPDACRRGLLKLKQALAETVHLRDLSNKPVTISIASDKYSKRFFDLGDYYSMPFSPDEDYQAYIQWVSAKADEEPVYQKFQLERVKEIRNKLTAKLKEEVGPWYDFHEAGRHVLCDIGVSPTSWSESFLAGKTQIPQEVLRMTGKKVTSLSMRSAKSGEHKTLIIELDSPPPARIEIVSYFDTNGIEKSYVQVDNKKPGSFWDNTPLTRFWFTPNCEMSGGEQWFYKDDVLQKRQWYDNTVGTEREVYVNQEVRTLEEIYGQCPNPASFQEVLTLASRVDRVLVTILDSGVDFNHPGLAKKIPGRPVGDAAKHALTKAKERLLEVRKSLTDGFNNLEQAQKEQQRGEFDARIAGLDRRIQESGIGWDFEDNDDKPYDYSDYLFNIDKEFDHGTHVAGIATQGTDDVAILPIRYPNSHEERFYQAIELAHQKGSRIVNISLGSDNKSYWEHLDKAIADFPDMLFVVAAGNEKADLDLTPMYPAAFNHPNMLVVASVDAQNNLSKFSNFSTSKVHVAAPGENIDSLEPQNSNGKKSGTSMATPYVTRVAAKIKFINPNLTPEDIIVIIRNSVTPVASLKDKVQYGGVVNEAKALTLAQETLK